MNQPGWQQPPVQSKRTPQQKCLHFGFLSAVLTLHLHPVGHEWVCTCGQKFVVVSDGPGGPKSLVKKS